MSDHSTPAFSLRSFAFKSPRQTAASFIRVDLRRNYASGCNSEFYHQMCVTPDQNNTFSVYKKVAIFVL